MDTNAAPGRIWYLVAVVICLAGFGGMMALLVPGLLAMEKTLVQIVVPGEAELTLDKAGSYSVFSENPSVVNGEIFSAPLPTGLSVSVISVQTGEAVPLSASSSASYTFGSRQGRSFAAFDIKEPGRYRVTGRYSDNRSEPRTVIAVGFEFVSSLMKTLLGSLAMAFGGIIAAIVTTVVVRRKRRAAGL